MCGRGGQDRGMETLHAVAAGIVPPLCAACGRSCRPEAIVCTRCGRRLAAAEPLLGKGPPGLDRAWSSAPHEGVARNLVAALKFRRLLPVAGLMADRIQWLAPAHMLSGAVVPGPPAPSRLPRRGFRPAGELAAALAERLGSPLEHCLSRRGGRRQVGRRRADPIGQPPQVHTTRTAPRSVVLVGDLLTTRGTPTPPPQNLRAPGAPPAAPRALAR